VEDGLKKEGGIGVRIWGKKDVLVLELREEGRRKGEA